MQLKPWQLAVLVLPIASVVIGLLVAAGVQIHEWGLNWIWALVTLIFVGWRWLLVEWTKAGKLSMESALLEIDRELKSSLENTAAAPERVNSILQQVLTESQADRPMWEDWGLFWQRCQSLIVGIAKIYHPEVKYPLLNIYVTQAYGLIRGTTDDMDAWMQKLAPALDRITIAQAYQAYETYQKLEPSARRLLKVWGWAQWAINPVAAVARRTTRSSTLAANQQLLGNLSQMLREAALQNLCRQAVALYGGGNLPFTPAEQPPAIPSAQTKSIADLLTQANPPAKIAAKPLDLLLVGRTGAGKSSIINSLFDRQLAAVDILPSTDALQPYQWRHESGEVLNLWDSPGYEQVKPDAKLGKELLDRAAQTDLLLLVTPALDPALQMDVDWLHQFRTRNGSVPIITIVSQVDRLRPLREWSPPYNWQFGEGEKETSIREAIIYRQEMLGEYADLVLPLVNNNPQIDRPAWGVDDIAVALVDRIAPTKQIRLARFITDIDAKSLVVARTIDRYTYQLTTTQGITQLVKNPLLQFLSTLATGSPTLAKLLATQIPIEQLPIAIGKIQMACELYPLFHQNSIDLIPLWPIILNCTGTADRQVSAFGRAIVEFWLDRYPSDLLPSKFNEYLIDSIKDLS